MLTPQNNNQAEKQNKLYKLDKEIFRALADESSDEAATGRRIVHTEDAASEAVSNEVNAMYLLDMPVFSINEAEAIGVVKNIIIDPVEKCLLALAVDKRGWYHDVRVIPAAKIRSIGEDVINIDEKQSAKRTVNLPRIVEYMHKPCGLVGNRIISDEGQMLGKVERFFLARDTGRISKLEISGGIAGSVFGGFLGGRVAVPASFIITIGADAVVVDRSCLEHLQINAGVLQVNFAAARDKAADIWQQTVVNTQRFGRGVLQHINEANEARRQSRNNRQQNLENAAEMPEILPELAANELVGS